MRLQKANNLFCLLTILRQIYILGIIFITACVCTQLSERRMWWGNKAISGQGDDQVWTVRSNCPTNFRHRGLRKTQWKLFISLPSTLLLSHHTVTTTCPAASPSHQLALQTTFFVLKGLPLSLYLKVFHFLCTVRFATFFVLKSLPLSLYWEVYHFLYVLKDFATFIVHIALPLIVIICFINDVDILADLSNVWVCGVFFIFLLIRTL